MEYTLKAIPFLALFIIIPILTYKIKIHIHFFTDYEWFFKRLHKNIQKAIKTNNKYAPHSVIKPFFKFAYSKTEDPKFILIIDYWENVYSRFPDEFITELTKSKLPQNPKEPFIPYFSGQKISKYEAYHKYYQNHELFYNRLLHDFETAKKYPDTYNPDLIATKLIRSTSKNQHPNYSSIIEFWYKLIECDIDILIKHLEERISFSNAKVKFDLIIYGRKKTNSDIKIDYNKSKIEEEAKRCYETKDEKIKTYMYGYFYLTIILKREPNNGAEMGRDWAKILKKNEKDFVQKGHIMKNGYYEKSITDDNYNNSPSSTRKKISEIIDFFKKIEFNEGIDVIEEYYKKKESNNQ